MLWEEFLCATVRPYPADWLIAGGWGCFNYLIRLDEDCVPFLVLGQNGGLRIEQEEDDEEDYAVDDDGGSEGIPEDAQGEGLPEADGTDWDDDAEEEGPDAGGAGSVVPYLRRVRSRP